jgi:hypothetical protein
MTLVYKDKISRRASHEMILLFAKHGNHYHDENFTTDASVKRAFLINNINYDQLVEKCRNPTSHVPYFENLIGSTWTVSGGCKMARVNGTGEEEFSVSGPGKFTELTYWALVEEVKNAKDRAVEKISYSDLQSAIVNGIASIESFINQKVNIWNKAFPDKQLIDNKTNKVSFDDKIKIWIPILTNGKKLDKSTVNWSDFKKLQGIRDNLAIHPKVPGYGFSYSDLANKINMLNTGIAGVLIDLHLLFNEKIPGVIIRLRYSPDVIVK